MATEAIPPEAFLAYGSRMNRYDKENGVREKKFRARFNMDPPICSYLWYLLCVHNPDRMTREIRPLYLLYALMRLNSSDSDENLSSTACCCAKTFRQWSWYMIQAISDLEGEMIDLENRFIGRDPGQTCLMSIDGVDFQVWEVVNQYPYKAVWCSHKHAKAAFRYEVGICIQTGDCVWIHGPHRGGSDVDSAIFKNCLRHYLEHGEQCEGDGHYQRNVPHFFPTPRTKEEIDLSNRARGRHESFNGLLKTFNLLRHIFKYGIEKHSDAVRACVVITQIRLERGDVKVFQVHESRV